MRILLVAYDFPPACTPRALRWRYLVRELILQGHDVHILMPNLGAVDVGFPSGPGDLHIHSTWPGPLRWLVLCLHRSHAGEARRGSRVAGGATGSGRTQRNWGSRLLGMARKLCGLVMYPDVRAEWTPWARRELRRILKHVQPDVTVTSHEPATTLPLGRLAQRLGCPWVADLGDPVYAHYTPGRWRRRALRLEAMVSRHADRVTVTTEATRRLLIERHGQDPARCIVLPNGYDDRRARAKPAASPAITFDADRLELICAGRLYAYRDPAGLLDTMSAVHGARLTLIVPDPLEGRIARLVQATGENVRLYVSMPHDVVMEALEAADVLVNFGTTGRSVQIPARLYEYLGLAHPILHVATGNAENDVTAQKVRELNRGWVENNDPGKLDPLLADLCQRKQQGRLHQGLALEPIASHAHSQLGRRLSDILATACADALDRRRL